MYRAARALALMLTMGCAAAAEAQDWRTLSSSRGPSGEDALKVDVEYGAGRLTIAPASPGVLYSAAMRYDARIIDPSMRYADGRLRIRMEGEGVRGRTREGGSLDLALGPDVPLDLELKFGAGRAEAELGGLRLRTLSLATGASDTKVRFSRPNGMDAELIDVQVGAAGMELAQLGHAAAERLKVAGGVGEVVLDFTGEWRRDLDVKVDMGLGSLRLVLPRGLGVKVQKEGLLASFDSQRFTKRGDAFYSEAWDGATHRLSVNISAAFSSIEVRWVDDVISAR